MGNLDVGFFVDVEMIKCGAKVGVFWVGGEEVLGL